MRLWVLLKIAKNRIGAIWRLSSAIMVSEEALVQAWPAERCLGISQLGLGFQGGFKAVRRANDVASTQEFFFLFFYFYRSNDGKLLSVVHKAERKFSP